MWKPHHELDLVWLFGSTFPHTMDMDVDVLGTAVKPIFREMACYR